MKTFDFTKVYNLDLKVTDLGLDGTAYNYRPTSNIKPEMNLLDQGSGDVSHFLFYSLC